MRHSDGEILSHALLSNSYVKDRTLRNNSTFLGEILSSHGWYDLMEMRTFLKRHFLVGWIHDFATDERRRNDRMSGARLQVISSIYSRGRLVPTLHR